MIGKIRRVVCSIALASFVAQVAMAAGLCCIESAAGSPSRVAHREHVDHPSDRDQSSRHSHASQCLCSAGGQQSIVAGSESVSTVSLDAFTSFDHRFANRIAPLCLAAQKHVLPLPQSPPSVS